MGNSGIATTAPAPRVGTVEVLVGLLAELDEATESGVFYDRVCKAVCSLTTMKRAALLLHDDTYRVVIPMGSYGVDPDLVKRIEGTLDETPIARLALEEDRVVEVHGPLSGQALLERGNQHLRASEHETAMRYLRAALAGGDLRRPRR